MNNEGIYVDEETERKYKEEINKLLKEIGEIEKRTDLSPSDKSAEIEQRNQEIEHMENCMYRPDLDEHFYPHYR